MKQLAAILALVVATSSVFAQSGSSRQPWTPEQAQALLDRTARTRLTPDLSHLTAGERQAVAKLLEVGQIFQTLYEQQRHRDAVAARTRLERARDAHSRNLLTLYRLFQGPIATTPDNQRRPFLDVAPETPGKNVYPADVTREALDAYLEAHPEERDALLGLRTVVRRATAENLDADLATLDAHPGIELLHPGLWGHLTHLRMRTTPAHFYAVPYAVAYADRVLRIRALLLEAADAVDWTETQVEPGRACCDAPLPRSQTAVLAASSAARRVLPGSLFGDAAFTCSTTVETALRLATSPAE